MKSVWYSIRAFVTAFVVVVFGGALVYLAIRGSEGALGVLGTTIGVIVTFYFASPTGSRGGTT